MSIDHVTAGRQGLPEETPSDYLDRRALRDLGVDPAVISRILRASPLTGHDRRKLVEADSLLDLLGMPENGGTPCS
jgi:hypothetical protein